MYFKKVTLFQKGTLSTEIENYRIRNKKRYKKKNKKYFKILSLFSKLILLILFFSVFICRAFRICSRSLSTSCAIKWWFQLEFSKLWFRNRMVLRWKAIELESLRCIVSCLERVVVVRTSYALFSLEAQSPREHLNKYKTLVLSRIQ